MFDRLIVHKTIIFFNGCLKKKENGNKKKIQRKNSIDIRFVVIFFTINIQLCIIDNTTVFYNISIQETFHRILIGGEKANKVQWKEV